MLPQENLGVGEEVEHAGEGRDGIRLVRPQPVDGQQRLSSDAVQVTERPGVEGVGGIQMRWSIVLRWMNVSPERHSSVSSPPNTNSASGPCVPLTAWASRNTAPFDRPIAEDAELAPKMMSGSVTFNSVSVHANAGSTTRHARTFGFHRCRSVR